MKKVLTVLLAIGLMASFVACDNQKDDQKESGENQNTVVSGENNGADNENNVSNSGEILPDEDDLTPSDEMQNLVDDLVEKSKVQFRMAAASKILLANAPTFVGLSEDLFTKYVKDSVVYEPMISPATSSLCIVKVSDDANVTELKQEIIDNCNPNKWICTGAEKCLVIDSGTYILLIMSSSDDCEAMKNAFIEHFGTENVGGALTKGGESNEENGELPPEMLAE